MKKIVTLFVFVVFAAFVFAGCTAEDTTITVGASPTPHAEILEIVKEDLEEQGYTLVIREFTDYVQPNLTLESGDLDANFFQHEPYLDDFNEENNTSLVSVAGVHYEPLGVYPGKTTSLEELQDGASIAVPNDGTNEARALLLLEAAGLITIDPNAGFTATINDITDNPKNFVIEEMEAAQITRALPDLDLAVINGNYALLAGLDVSRDSLTKEEKDSLSATTYTNILAVRVGDEDREGIKALVEALTSDKVRQFIEEQYDGSVVPMF